MPEAHHPALAHHFDDLEQQKEAATLGMWVFLVTEVMFFGGLFTVYAVYRTWYPEAFVEGSHHLGILAGAVNTVVLIGSSLTMALAVHAAATGSRRGQVIFLLLTIALGLVFLGIKAYEYYHKYEENLIPGPGFALSREVGIFMSLYFALTGLHALHMIVGVGLLSWLVCQAWRGRFGSEYYSPVEIIGLYWHFVDIIWIFLFPLLYLVAPR